MSTVAAVIVTFNRKGLLIECLEAVRGQTRPCERVFIIDNSSTDGTPELLADEGVLDGSIEYVRLPVNTGSAGGFHEGVRRAYAAGHDRVLRLGAHRHPGPHLLAAAPS